MAESEEELKSFLMRVKEESEKAGLKRNKKKKPKIIAPSPITSWQIEGEKAQTVIHFILGGLQNLCSHEIKSHLILGRKPMTKLDSVLKSRVITLPTKVCLVKAKVFFSSHAWM